MKSLIVPKSFVLALFFAFERSAVAAISRQGIDTTARASSLLRRETSETEASEVSHGGASIPVTSEIRTGNFSSEQVWKIVEKMSFSERKLMTRSNSPMGSMSQTVDIPSWARTKTASVTAIQSGSHGAWINGDGNDEFFIHNCDSDASICDFCGPAGSVSCYNNNCYMSDVSPDEPTCVGIADGAQNSSGSPDTFCLGEKISMICPPATCDDINGALESGVTCGTLKEDPSFDLCGDSSLQTLATTFCRYTCSQCIRATCGNGNGGTRVTCPAGSATDSTKDSKECADVTCRTSALTGEDGYDTSTCCEVYECATGSDEMCKVCEVAELRTAQNHCKECNDDYYISGTSCDFDTLGAIEGSSVKDGCEEAGGNGSNSTKSNCTSNSSAKSNTTEKKIKLDEPEPKLALYLVLGFIGLSILVAVCFAVLHVPKKHDGECQKDSTQEEEAVPEEETPEEETEQEAAPDAEAAPIAEEEAAPDAGLPPPPTAEAPPAAEAPEATSTDLPPPPPPA